MLQLLPLIAASLWLIIANVIAMSPSKDHHWKNAYLLMALGLPLTIWLTRTQGILIALIFLACAASILRWPLYSAWKRLRGAGAGCLTRVDLWRSRPRKSKKIL